MTAVTDAEMLAAHSAAVGNSPIRKLEHSMKLNVGSIDRTLRIVGGLVLIGLAATGTVGVWGWIGVVPLLTGLVGFCPVYPLLGINTCPMKKA